jgi:hypothetical protein
MALPAHGMGSVVVDALVELVSVTLRGQVPLATTPFIAGALVLRLLKPDTVGIRAIACGGILRRLVSKIAVEAVLPILAD